MRRDDLRRPGERARAPGCRALGTLLWLPILLACSSAPKGEPAANGKPGTDETLALPGERAKKSPATELPGEAPPPEQADRTAPAVTAPDLEAALAYDPADPLADLEAADALDGAGTVVGDVKVPAGGCAVTQPGQRIWANPGPATIVSLGHGFAVLGYGKKDARDQLFLVRAPGAGLPEPITAIDIEPPHPRARIAPPGASARSDNDIMVAFTDGEGALFARRLRVGRGGMGPRAKLADGVDTRFAPAVAHHEDDAVVAWTLGTTPMQVHAAVIDDGGKVSARHDVTPVSMGASAPTFVAGASPPSLLTIDARDGMSPIVRTDFGGELAPGQGEVAVPVGMVSAPSELAAASSSVGTYVGYTGLGSASTSAVGLVAIAPIAGAPSALVKGTAYGQLHVAATQAPRAVIFAADAPTEAGKDPPHEIHVHVVGMQGPGPATVLRGPGGRAAHAAIARDDTGQVGVVYTADSGVYLARLECDDGGG